MKIRFLNSLRFRIFLMSLVAVAPLIALSVYHAQEDRNRENKDLRDEAIQLVNCTLIEEAQTIDGTRQLLLSLSNLPMLYFKDSLVCREYLSKLLTKYSRYVNLGVVNNNGKLFASGRSDENIRDFRNHEFFIEVLQSGEFSVGEYFVDQVSQKRVINLGYPIFDKRRGIKAVLFASLDVSYIDAIEKDLAKVFHEESLFIKIDDEGNILATNSPSNELIKNVVTPAFLKIISEQNNGIIEAPGPNKQNYLFVFATTKSNLFQDKLYLVVGADKERFFSEINATLFRNLFLIGALFAIILAGVLTLSDKYILKTVKKLINATNEMSTGNLSVRSNVGYNSGELGQLAMTFDRMAESLEDQNNKRSKIEETLRESEERFRNLFEHSPVSLWWEDHSEIKRYIDQLRASGIEDFRIYFQTQPEELAHCVTMLKVIAVNKATLQLYQAKSKEDLLKGLLIIFRKESYAVFTEELIALTSGKTVFECEAITQTLTGKRNYVIFKLLILPGYEETWSKVLVSMTDITERKQAEAQIRFQASLLEQVSNGVAVTDMEGKVIYWNRYAEILHGWKAEEVIGKSVLDFLVSEKQKKLAQEMINSIFHKERAEVEIPLLKKNGEDFPAHVSYSVLRNASGEPRGILGISTDISERKRAEGTIRLQSEIVKNIAEAVYLVNANDLTIIFANLKMESMFGYGPGEMNGMHVSIINAPSGADPVQVAKEIEKTLIEVGTWRGEVRNIRKDGTPFWCQATISRFDHPELGAIYISLQLDITERKRTEMLLREAHERLQTIIQASPLAILAIDPHGSIMNWNTGAEQMFGWSEQETVGKVCPTVPSEWLSDFHDMITQVVQGKTFSGLLRSRQKKDGTQINASLISAPLRNAAGEAIGAIVILEDVTERTKSEEEKSKLLTEVQEADNQPRLLSRRLLETQESERKNISRELHDEIGQTLTAAKINLQSIQRITKSSKIAEDLAITISYIEQSLQQVRDISLNLRPSILDDLGIEAALRWLLRRIAESAKIKCELVFDLPGVELSKEMQLNCYRIAQEALNNIAKHSRAKNAVVNLTAVEDAIHLIIKDNGKGFNLKEVREQALKGKSLGILSMEERAQLAGGEFKITSSTKNGTEIHTIFQL